MFRALATSLLVTGLLAGGGIADQPHDLPPASLPQPGKIMVDAHRGEVILSAVVQHPTGKPCIDQYGQRIQAFVGCATAAGDDTDVMSICHRLVCHCLAAAATVCFTEPHRGQAVPASGAPPLHCDPRHVQAGRCRSSPCLGAIAALKSER